MGEAFENRDMAGAVFHNVNLYQAVFDDVNLGAATIQNANLGDVSIENANIKGMTICGIRIDEFIEAELDRRDPERARLRLEDRYDPDSVRAVIARLEQVRSEFYQLLRATRPELLVIRPGPGKWSAIEQVRHLLFAEDLYLNRWVLRNDKPWNKLGLLPSFLAGDEAYADVGSQPRDDLEAILAAWDDVHASTQAFLAGVTTENLQRGTRDVDFGQGTVGQVLQGMAQHDLHHIRRAEAIIAELTA